MLSRAHGGYRLAIDPESMKLTEFFEVIEGPMGIMDCYFDSGASRWMVALFGRQSTELMIQSEQCLII